MSSRVLTPSSVRTIRRLRDEGHSLTEIARAMSMSKTTAHRAISGEYLGPVLEMEECLRPCPACGKEHDRRHGRNLMPLACCSDRCSKERHKGKRIIWAKKNNGRSTKAVAYTNGRCIRCEEMPHRREDVVACDADTEEDILGCVKCGGLFAPLPPVELQCGFGNSSPLAAAEKLAPGIIGIKNGLLSRTLPSKAFTTCCHSTRQKKREVRE